MILKFHKNVYEGNGKLVAKDPTEILPISVCIFNSFNVVIELCGTKAVDRARLIFMLVAEHLRDFQARIEIMKTLSVTRTARRTHKGQQLFDPLSN